MGSTLTEKLERLQKRAARVVLREGASKDPVSRAQLGWANLPVGGNNIWAHSFSSIEGRDPTCTYRSFLHCTAGQTTMIIK